MPQARAAKRASAVGEPPERRAMVLAVVLAGMAGWVDAVGFVHWHGLFVSFMSGNTTETAAGIDTDWGVVVASGRAVLVFVLGVLLGELLGSTCGRWGRPAVLAFESALLWMGLWSSAASWGQPATASLLGLAMGVQNASVHHANGVGVALTFVTGTLVKIGHGLAEAIRGAGSWHAILPHLGLWLGLFVGALGGAATARGSEAVALAAVAVLASALTGLTGAAARRIGPPTAQRPAA